MSIEYKIAAIPTEYRGRKYRSRLEAKYAAFFDLLELRAEYEPFDLGAWSPDFLIRPDFSYDRSILVEVKPIHEFDADTMRKALKACRERKILDVDGDTGVAGILLVGVCPTLSKEGDRANIGWFTYGFPNDDLKAIPVSVGWLLHESDPKVCPDVVNLSDQGYFCVGCGDADDKKYAAPFRFYPSHTMSLWSQACNAVQWHPRKK